MIQQDPQVIKCKKVMWKGELSKKNLKSEKGEKI